MNLRIIAVGLVQFGFCVSSASASSTSQFVCTIGGVYTNERGKLVQRRDDKAVGKIIYVNVDTGEATGHFGTDGFDVIRVRRPDNNESLTIETAVGLEGDAANRLRIEPADQTTRRHAFIYNKGWLVISGECEAVRRYRSMRLGNPRPLPPRHT